MAVESSPDNDTGIGNWTKAEFLAHFHAWAGKAGAAQKVHLDLDKGDYVILMPYLETSGMTDQDLGAIYDYLRSVPAVKNPVNRFDPPSP